MTTVTKKIDTLDPMTDTVANNDKLLMLDVSAEAVSMTKLMTMNQIPISLAAQLSTDVVENAKIKDGAVTTSKLDQAGTTQAVSTATIRNDAVTFAKLQNVDAYSVIGKKGTGSGDADEIVAGENAVLGRVGTGDIAFSKLATTQLANTNARTVIGNATNASATPTAIASNADGYVLRQNGDALGFGTLTNTSLATGAVIAGKIAAGGVSASTQFTAQVVDTAALKDANVTLAKMAANSVDSSKIVDGSIVAADLAANAVTTIKIADAQVTTAKIADANVTPEKLSDTYLTDNVNGIIELGARRTSSDIAYIDFHSIYPINSYDARIVSYSGELGVDGKGALSYFANSHNFTGTINGTLADSIVGNAQIAANAVDSSKIVDGSIVAADLATNAVITVKIADANVTLGKMAANSVDSDQYVDGSIDTVHLANSVVTQAKLGAIKRMIMVPVFWFEDLVVVKNCTHIMAWHPDLNGHIVTGAWAALLGAVSSSGAVTIDLINAGGTMASISIGAGAWSAQSGAISGSYDDIGSLTGFSVNVTGAGTGAKGLIVYLEVTG